MPWKSDSFPDQRSEFIAQWLRRKMPLAPLCRRFAISRKTAYKWIARFRQHGRRGLRDCSRAAARVHNRPAPHWLARIRRWRTRHPSWGAPKLRWALQRRFGARGLPSEAAISRWLNQWGLSRGRHRRPAHRGPRIARPALTPARHPNAVWSADFKGWFRTGDGTRVEPLTVRDMASRYILATVLLAGTQLVPCRAAFLRIFREHGLPAVIRVDNGTPFGATGAWGLTRLSAWWVKLGIRVEFIEPGRPDQNGAHEQMHRIYKAETLHPPAATLAAQKRRTARWRHRYNHARPHEALGMAVPAESYRKSRRKLPAQSRPWRYPRGWSSRLVKGKGMISLEGNGRYIGEAFEGERVGLQRCGAVWHVYFGPLLLGQLHAHLLTGIQATWFRKRNRRE
jgi:transposase InsO family protein